MAFSEHLEQLLPPYLTSIEKGRLQTGLSQFMPEHRGEGINYNDFYKEYQNNKFFRQADLLREIRFPIWNNEAAIFEKAYTDAIIISNTCDISFENTHTFLQKECLMAPVLDLSKCIEEFTSNGYPREKIKTFCDSIRRQEKSQIFYLPNVSGEEKIALLDQMFWFPVKELSEYIQQMDVTKISSLSHFGFYLFIFKISYHLCRLPESCDREVSL